MTPALRGRSARLRLEQALTTDAGRARLEVVRESELAP